MKKNLVIASCATIAIIIGYLFYANSQNPVTPITNNSGECSNMDIGVAKNQAQLITKNLSTYVTSTKDVFGKSSEGGTQIDYFHDGIHVAAVQKFFGETGKSEIAYYFKNNKVFYINKKNIEYTVPLSQDPAGEPKKTQTKDFYLGGDQVLCSWYQDEELQPIDRDSEELVRFLISGLY